MSNLIQVQVERKRNDHLEELQRWEVMKVVSNNPNKINKTNQCLPQPIQSTQRVRIFHQPLSQSVVENKNDEM